MQRAGPARITAVALIAVTTLKCFLYDLESLGGLYRVGSFVGLALSLVLVSMALKKYVLSKPKDAMMKRRSCCRAGADADGRRTRGGAGAARSHSSGPHRRKGAGRSRLAVDVTLLSRGIAISSDRSAATTMVAEGGLNDLRLFDASGRPVPYLLVQRRQETRLARRPDPAGRIDQDHQRLRGRLRNREHDRSRASGRHFRHPSSNG